MIDEYGLPVANLKLLTLIAGDSGTGRVDMLLDIQVDEASRTVSGTSAFALLQQIIGDGTQGEGSCFVTALRSREASRRIDSLRTFRNGDSCGGSVVARNYYRLCIPKMSPGRHQKNGD